MTTDENAQQAAEPHELELHECLDPDRLRNAEGVFRIFHVVVPVDTPRQRLVVPRFWIRSAHKFSSPAIDQAPDWIICRPPDGSWFAWLLVVSVSAEGVEVVSLASTELPHRRGVFGSRLGPQGTNLEDFHFEDLGPGEGCQVVRTHDNHPMYKGQTRDQCTRWLSSHLRTVRV